MYKMPSSPKRNEKLSRLDDLNKTFRAVLVEEYGSLTASDCPYQNLVKILDDVASFMGSYDKIFKTPQIEPSASEAKELSNKLDSIVTAITNIKDKDAGNDFKGDDWYEDSGKGLLENMLDETKKIKLLLITPGSPKPQYPG